MNRQARSLQLVQQILRRCGARDSLVEGLGAAHCSVAGHQERTVAAAAGRLVVDRGGAWQHSKTTASFVFDIDGVLVRGKQVLPAAKRALASLYSGCGTRPLYPVAFLTNGGGVTEAVKAEQLSGWLGVHVEAEQVVLAHTPFRSLTPALGNEPVLALGRGEGLPALAATYGFRRAVTSQQLQHAMPQATPFSKASGHGPDPGTCPVRDQGLGSPSDPFKAVLVFNDPENWYTDLQLAIDVIVGGGVLRGRCPPPSSEGGEEQQVEVLLKEREEVEVYFSNQDLLWVNEHPVPRFGQGAFAAALQELHRQVTGKPLARARYFGKPHPEPYQLVGRLLEAQAIALGQDPRTLRIYAVGDNPAADVRGANAAGHPWVSVLVRTGVFRGPGRNCVIDPAHVVVDDVEAAVKAALHRTRAEHWHSMR